VTESDFLRPGEGETYRELGAAAEADTPLTPEAIAGIASCFDFDPAG
jgi:hypothetical protein